MATYPGLPDNRLIVNGVDICERFKLALLDGYTLSPPDPKTYTVDIPGGNGVIDLTEALAGDVVYKNRSQSFTFACIDPSTSFESVKTELSNFIHGRYYDYTMTMDPGYTYHGRFTLSSYSHEVYANGFVGTFKMDVDAKPYKTKEKCVYKLNATGGKWYSFESGRRPVHPTLECTETCFITWKDKEYTISPGAYRLNKVTFTDGMNDLYVNSRKLYTEKWLNVAEDGDDAMTWDTASQYTWDSIQRIGITTKGYQKWLDIANIAWGDFAEDGSDPTRWNEADYRNTEDYAGNATVYLAYEWEDL